MGIFDSNSPGISVALDVPWPANVSSGPGVLVDKTTGQWTVGLDFPDLVDGGSPANPSDIYLAGYDAPLLRYEKLRLDNVIASASGVDSRTVIGNANYAVLLTDRYIGLAAALTAIRTITLPAAASVPPGRTVTLQDETGGISDAFYLSIAVTGADTINGGSSWILKTTRGGAAFRSNGTNAWNVMVAFGRSPVADANYTATRGDQLVAYTSISTARTVTLPAASAFQVGQRLMVIDESGSCSGTNTITVNRAGADTINGATSTAIGQAYGYVAVESNGVSKWTIVDTAALSSGTITSSQISDSTPLGRTDIGATRAVVGNAAYTIQTTDRLVVTSVALTLPRVWTLPFAADVPAGTEIKFSDEAAVATPTNTVSIARASAPDTINGAIGQQVVLGKGVRQKSSVRSDGVSNWILSSLFGPLDGSTVGATTPSTGAFTTIAGTSASANALAVGRQGTTDPGLNVNASVASCVTGVNISSRAAGGSVFVSAISSASNEALAIDSKGSSTLFLGGNSSGGVSIAGGGGTTIVNGPLTLNATPFVVPGQCRLIRVGSTQVRLTPFNGNMIKINGDMYPIPAAGINLASGTFSAATFYYIYAFQTAGVVSLENSTTGHVTDTTAGNVGVEIKSGDATRTLVGAAQLNGGGVFEDSDTNRLVISWFNRQLKRVENTFSTVRTTASTTAVELHAEIRCNFLCWVDDALRISANGSTFNSAAGTNNTGIGIDGLTVDGVTSAQATTYIPLGLNESRTFLTENVAHYATLVGYVSASTGSWVGANVNCKLSGSILG